MNLECLHDSGHAGSVFSCILGVGCVNSWSRHIYFPISFTGSFQWSTVKLAIKLKNTFSTKIRFSQHTSRNEWNEGCESCSNEPFNSGKTNDHASLNNVRDIWFMSLVIFDKTWIIFCMCWVILTIICAIIIVLYAAATLAVRKIGKIISASIVWQTNWIRISMS